MSEIWTPPGNWTSGEVDSGRFNDEIPGNIRYLKDEALNGQRFAGGRASGTTATVAGQAGVLVVIHGLTWTPEWVVVTGESPNGGTQIAAQSMAYGFTSTQFRVRLFHPSGASLPDGTAVTVSWIAGRSDPA